MPLESQTTRSPRTAPQGSRLPDFIIIGSPKSGTTTLYLYLCRHPAVFMSTPKEMSFFSKDEVYARGFDWYCGLFAPAHLGQLCGEASTTYTRWPTYLNAAERIAAAIPAAKLLYVIRNPVDRLYSFYGHRMRERATMSLEQFLDATPEAVHSGNYMTQIEQYLKHFPRKQIHVLLLDDLKADPAGELESVRQFLELPEFDFLSRPTVAANTGNGRYAATMSLTAAIDRLNRLPLAGSLLRRLPAASRQKAFRWLQEGPVGRTLSGRHMRKLTPLTPALRTWMAGLFAHEIDRLEEFLERDLSSWRVTSYAEDQSA